jgi:hypothetical protein
LPISSLNKKLISKVILKSFVLLFYNELFCLIRSLAPFIVVLWLNVVCLIELDLISFKIPVFIVILKVLEPLFFIITLLNIFSILLLNGLTDVLLKRGSINHSLSDLMSFNLLLILLLLVILLPSL